MADDTIFNYVQNYMDGKIDRKVFWELAKFKRPTHEISFHTAKASAALQFIQGSEVRDEVPDYWTIGEVYERLIEDIAGDNADNIIDCLLEVYSSWIDGVISNYNTDFYYQSQEYIYECYKEGKICA